MSSASFQPSIGPGITMSVNTRSIGSPLRTFSKACRRVGGGDRLVSQQPQLLRDKITNDGVVFDTEDGLVAARKLFSDFVGGKRRRMIGYRKIQLERGPPAVSGFELDVAAGLLDEPVHHAETEPGALADAFGAEEGFVNLALNGLVDPGSRIGDADRDISARGKVAGGGFVLIDGNRIGIDRQPASARHGIARVYSQIDQC